jgi:hypothetical protein
VELALQMILSQPHSLSLLQEANEAALSVLRRQERHSPKAEALRQATVQPDWTARHTRRLEKLVGVAACLMVICLIKIGVFSSLKDIHDDGQTAMHNYYARNLDPEMMGELFDEPTQQA